MNKEAIKGLLILLAVGMALALLSIVGTEHGWQKLGCVARAIVHGIALSNIRSVCL